MKLLRYLFIAALIVGTMSCARGGKMTAITVSPASKVIAEGKTQQFEATAIFSDGTVLTWTSVVTWTITPDKDITIGNTFGTYGLVTSTSGTTSGTGDFTVTATDATNGLSSSVVLHVRRPDIAITPANAFIPLGVSHQFKATGTMVISEGTGTTTVDLTSSATWTIISDIPDIATVGAKTGIVTASSTLTGQGLIEAAYLSSLGTTTVSIMATPLDNLIIQAPPDTGPISRSTKTIQFLAQGTFQDHSTTALLTNPWIWSSSSPNIAGIDAETGLATFGSVDGTTIITAKDPISHLTGTRALTVGP